jgi:hypothetical protein
MPESKQDLLKFCGPTEYSLKNLADGVIYCQHYSVYNDPFEFWSNIYEGIPDALREPERFAAALRAWGMEGCSPQDEDVIAYFNECKDYQPPFQEMRDEVRIACFGSQRDNLLMWSHYADGLRGFCIVFDEKLVTKAEPEGYVVDVAYIDAPPTLDSFVYAIARDQDWYHQMAIDETETRIQHLGKTDEMSWIPIYEQAGAEALRQMQEIWQLVFAAKPTEWKYEGERRLLVQSPQSDTAPILRPYPREAIKEVILGERMVDHYRVQILALMKKRYPEVPVRTARRAKGVYTLVID